MQGSITATDPADVKEEVALRARVNDIRRKTFPLDSVAWCQSRIRSHAHSRRLLHPATSPQFRSIRLTLDGVFSTGHGDLAPGECGYFLEGYRWGKIYKEADVKSE